MNEALKICGLVDLKSAADATGLTPMALARAVSLGRLNFNQAKGELLLSVGDIGRIVAGRIAGFDDMPPHNSKWFTAKPSTPRRGEFLIAAKRDGISSAWSSLGREYMIWQVRELALQAVKKQRKPGFSTPLQKLYAGPKQFGAIVKTVRQSLLSITFNIAGGEIKLASIARTTDIDRAIKEAF